MKYLISILTILSSFPNIGILWTEGQHAPKLVTFAFLTLVIATLTAGILGLFYIKNTKFFIFSIILILLNIFILIYALHIVSSSINNKMIRDSKFSEPNISQDIPLNKVTYYDRNPFTSSMIPIQLSFTEAQKYLQEKNIVFMVLQSYASDDTTKILKINPPENQTEGVQEQDILPDTPIFEINSLSNIDYVIKNDNTNNGELIYILEEKNTDIIHKKTIGIITEEKWLELKALLN